MDWTDLRPYQVRTVEEIVSRERLIAVLDMGAGKTISTLTAFVELQDNRKVDRLWVIAPKRVAQTVWAREAADWDHTRDLYVVNLAGLSPKKREAALAADADVYVCSYDLVDWVAARAGPFPADTMLVLDEVTRVKSAKSKRGKTIRELFAKCERRVGLTGSPRAKDRLDLFGQVLTIAGPSVWGSSFWKWQKTYFVTTDWQGYVWEPKPGADAKIDRDYESVAFRVETGRASVAQLVVEPVTLPADALAMHETALKEAVLAAGGVDQALQGAADATNKARQIAGGTVVMEQRRRSPDGASWLPAKTAVVHREKLAVFLELVEAANEAQETLLVLYGYRAEIDLMRPVLPPGSVILDEVPDDRVEATIEAWNRGEVPVLVGHPASMGHGLNLQKGGRRLVWWTLPWSLELYEQTIARLDRPGQTRTVYNHVLVAEGTLDGLVLSRLQGRAEAQDALKARLAAAVSL